MRVAIDIRRISEFGHGTYTRNAIRTLARLDKGLEPAARFSPIYYYQSGDAIEGLKGRWLTGLGAAAGLFVALAWWCFKRRDIRVVGEGGWRWPVWSRKKPAPS